MSRGTWDPEKERWVQDGEPAEDIDQLREDSEMLRWLLSGHTVEELDTCMASGAQPAVTPQDECIARLGSWYCTLDESLETIRAAMKAVE